MALGRQTSALLNDRATAASDNDDAAVGAVSDQLGQVAPESNEIAITLGATACTV